MSDVNIPLLRKAVEWAEAEAAKPWEVREWHQASWAHDPKFVEPSGIDMAAGVSLSAKKSTDCGTCYCIAGYVTAMAGATEEPFLVGPLMQTVPGFEHLTSQEFAQRELGLSEGQASALFMASNTIADVRRIAEEIAGESL